jgi:hypothetical protein
MLKSFINIFFLFFTVIIFSQEKVNDTIKYKDRYGLRVGIDIVAPVYSLFDDDRKGLEFVADYRVSKRFFIATEFGYLENTDQEDFFNYTTNGQYIKVGADFNAYKNWIGMENVIVVGLRYAFSAFDQTLNEYTINADPFLPEKTVTTSTKYDNLNAQWIEFVLGIKVEVMHNIFLGFSFRGNKLISSKEPDNFKNLFIPGFNKVFLNDNGFSFNYTISYLIPIYRK